MTGPGAGSAGEASNRFTAVALFVVIVSMLLITVGFLFLDRRLDELDERTTFAPARSYEPVDVASLAAEEPGPDEIAVRRTVYVPVYSHVFF